MHLKYTSTNIIIEVNPSIESKACPSSSSCYFTKRDGPSSSSLLYEYDQKEKTWKTVQKQKRENKSLFFPFRPQKSLFSSFGFISLCWNVKENYVILTRLPPPPLYCCHLHLVSYVSSFSFCYSCQPPWWQLAYCQPLWVPLLPHFHPRQHRQLETSA